MKHSPSVVALAVVGLAGSAAAQTTPPPGKWTVIVHGRTGGCAYPANYNDLTASTGWMRQLAARIESLNPGAVSIYTMEAATLNLITANGGTGGTNPLDPTKHHVVMFDWGATSDFAPAICNPPAGGDRNGYAYAAGDSLHALLHRWNAQGAVFGLIGYSRGAIVVSEAARRLMAEGNNPAQVVFLDGEGCNSGGCGLYTDGSFDAWAPVAGSVRFDNVLESVNERYLAPSPCTTDLGGHIKNRCGNVNLGTAFAHTTWGFTSSCLPSYSQGAITGYLISGLVVQAGRYAYPNAAGAIVDPNPPAAVAPASPFNGDMAFASVAGWYGGGGGGAATVSSLGGQTTLHLARGQSQTHNFAVIPACGASLRFAAATDGTTVGDCTLSIVLQSAGVADQELGPVALSTLPSNLGTVQQVLIPSVMQGKVGVVKFSVVGTSGGGGVHLAGVNFTACAAPCYANCDTSTIAPVLTANDFQCYLNRFAAADTYANCDGSTTPPVLTANDFQCFLNAFAAGCS